MLRGAMAEKPPGIAREAESMAYLMSWCWLLHPILPHVVLSAGSFQPTLSSSAEGARRIDGLTWDDLPLCVTRCKRISFTLGWRLAFMGISKPWP